MKFSVFQASRRGGRQKNEGRMGCCCTSDNLTALAWEVDDASSARTISTDGDGAFESNVQSSAYGDQPDDMDDAAIERSMAEINAAIRRSAARKA